MSRTFFVAGGTLDAAAPSYVVRAADEELYRALRDGEFCYVLTPRQTGKSSLMVRTALRLRADGVTAAALDLTASGQNLSAEQWYAGLLDSLARQCGHTDALEDYWEAHRRWGPAQRWVNAIIDVLLPHCANGLVLFVDEIDFVRSLPFPTDEFFAAIRECHNRRATDPQLRALTFCLLGVATPADLIRDPRATPFNVGQRIDLADFTEEESSTLAPGLEKSLVELGQGRAARALSKQMLRRILYWTNGHPYLTQRLCYELTNDDSSRESGGIGPKAVDRLCQTLFLSPAAQRQDINTLSVRDRLLLDECEGDRAALLDLYGRVLAGALVPDDETNRLVGLLRLSGAVVALDRRLRVRNRIYARLFDRGWVSRHMPDAELQRQRRAVRIALLRASAVASIAILSFGGLAGMALSNEAKANEYARSQQVAVRDRDQALADLRKALLEARNSGQRANREAAAAQRARTRATNAAAAKEVQRRLAELRTLEANRARAEAIRQGKVAEERGRQSALRLARLHVADGWRRVEQGDSLGALLHFEEALKGDRLDPGRERLHRMRLAAVLAVSPRLTQIWRHDAGLNFAAYRPDGRRIVVVGDDRVVRVGDDRGGWVSPSIGRPAAGEAFLGTAQFAEDGVTVRSVIDGKEQFVSPGAARPPVGSDTEGVWVSYTPTAHLRIVADGELIRVFDARTRRLVAGRHLVPPIQRRPLVSGDGGLVATVHRDGSAQVWRLPDLSPACPPLRHGGTIMCLDFNRAGDLLVTGSEDRSARIWDLKSGRSRPALPHAASVMDVKFSPDGQRVATAAIDGVARVWDAGTGRAVTPPLVHTLGIHTIRFSPEGARVVTASADGTARVWDAVTGRPTCSMLTHGGAVMSASFHPSGRRVLTACSDGLAREWDLVAAEPIRLAAGAAPSVLPRPPLLVGDAAPVPGHWNAPIDRPALVLGQRGLIALVRFPDGRVGPKLPAQHVTTGDVSADGLRVLTADREGKVRLWESLTGRELLPPLRHRLAAHLARFSPDGRWILSSSLDGTTRIWDAATGRPRTPALFQSEMVREAAMSADGHLLATATDGTIRVWDAVTGEALTPFMRRRIPTTALAFEGDALWVRTQDERWRRWDLAPLTWSLPRLRELAALLTGRTQDGAGGTIPNSSQALASAWASLRSDYVRAWKILPEDEREWHQAEATEREVGRQWTAAAFHLGQVLQVRPNAGPLRVRRAMALAESADWTEAAREFAQVMPVGTADSLPDQHLVGYRLALCQLAAGDKASYRDTCLKLLARYGDSPSDRVQDIATWSAVLAPEGPAEAALPLSRALARRNPDNLGLLQTLGALQFRTGSLEAARDTLLEVVRRRGNGGEAMDHLFLALVLRQLNRETEAVRHLGLADVELQSTQELEIGVTQIPWETRLELRLLRQQANDHFQTSTSALCIRSKQVSDYIWRETRAPRSCDVLPAALGVGRKLVLVAERGTTGCLNIRCSHESTKLESFSPKRNSAGSGRFDVRCSTRITKSSTRKPHRLRCPRQGNDSRLG